MDGTRFDAWIRTIAHESSRRSLLASLGRGMVGLLAGSAALRRAPAEADDGLRLDVLACLGLTPRLAAEVCIGLNLPHVAQTGCVEGRCAIVACDPGWADCDGDVANGCETPLGTDVDCAACGDGCARLDDTCSTGACVDSTCVAQPANEGAPCDDESLCTEESTCQGGACVALYTVVCTAQDDCHVAGTCDPATGTCSNPAAPDGTVCGVAGGGTCQGGDCVTALCVPIGDVCETIDDCCVGWCDNESFTCQLASVGNPCRTDLDCFEGLCTDDVCTL